MSERDVVALSAPDYVSTFRDDDLGGEVAFKAGYVSTFRGDVAAGRAKRLVELTRSR